MPEIIKTKRFNRFKNKFKRTSYIEESFNTFTFGNSLNSYNNSDLYFTNYVKNKDNAKYKKLEEYVIKTLYGDYSFVEEDFGFLDEIQYTQFTGNRLLNIINNGYKHKYKLIDLKYIFKIHHTTKKGFELYIKNSRNNLVVILIDIFHLAIPGDRKIAKNIVIPKDLERDYNEVKENNCDLKNIL